MTIATELVLHGINVNFIDKDGQNALLMQYYKVVKISL